MIIDRMTKQFLTCSLYPDTNWCLPDKAEWLLIDEATEQGRELSEAVQTHYPFFDLEVEGDTVVGVRPWATLEYTVDKTTVFPGDTVVIQTSPGTIALLGEKEYTLDDGTLEYSNENVGEYKIVLRREGWKPAVFYIGVIPSENQH